MILPSDELRKLTELKHRSPHSVLGLHPHANPPGLVARALLPNASKVTLQPIAKGTGVPIELQRVHKSGLFEGATDAATEVFKYELVIIDDKGNPRTIRDPPGVAGRIA